MANTHTGTGTGVRTLTHSLTWPFLLLSLASLTVFMAGLAATQQQCGTYGMPGITQGLGSQAASSSPTGVFGMSTGYRDCVRLHRFYWFSWAFVLATLLGILITAVLNWGLHHSRPFWIGMLAVSTILMMIASEAFLSFTDLVEGINPAGVADNTGDGVDNWIRRFRTAAAGAIITTAFLVLLMMAIGTDWEHRRGHGRNEKNFSGVAVTQPGTVPVSNVRMVDQV